MEDATDFCFESAKVCHAVVLTIMELGKLSWHETEKLDRLGRTHAQNIKTFQRLIIKVLPNLKAQTTQIKGALFTNISQTVTAPKWWTTKLGHM